MTNQSPSFLIYLGACVIVFIGTSSLCGEKSKVQVAICSNDSRESISTFQKSVNSASDILVITEIVNCSETGPTVLPKFIGRFVPNQNGDIFFEVGPVSNARDRRYRETPWLNSMDLPLAQTIGASKVVTLSMLLDSMLLDFDTVKLSKAPTLTIEEKNQEALRDGGGRGQSDDEVFYAIDVEGGAAYVFPYAFAPLVSAGFGVGKSRWFGLARFQLAFDSNFEIESRPFDTFQIGTKMGAGYLLLSNGRFRISSELLALWQYSIFSRADRRDAANRTWSDFGVGLFVVGRVQLKGVFGLFLMLGIEVYPTARTVEIEDGPNLKTGLLSVPVSIGFNFIF